MEITEAQVYEALNMEAPGAQVQEPAEPAADAAEQPPQTGEGAQVQEVAEPADEDQNTPESDDDEQESPAAEPDDDAEPMSKEQRRENAARRRKQELDAAVEQARQEERQANEKKWQEFFQKAKLKNAMEDNKPIASLQDFEAWQEAIRQKQAERDLKAGKLTPEAVEDVIKRTPAFQKIEQLQTAAEQAREQAEKDRFQQQAKAEMQEIGKLNPKIKTLTDIMAMETGKQFAKYVQQNGLSFLEAYKLANPDQLTRTAAVAAAQQAKNAVASKNHLQSTATRGKGSLPVPKEERGLWSALFPSASEKEIAAMYNSQRKEE